MPFLAQPPEAIAPRVCRWHEEADSQRIGHEWCLAQRDSHQAECRGVALAPFSFPWRRLGRGRFSRTQEEFADGDLLYIGPPALGIGYRVRIEAPVNLSAAFCPCVSPAPLMLGAASTDVEIGSDNVLYPSS